MRRFALLILLFAVPLVASAHEGHGGIEVIDVSGPLDASALEFMAESIEAAAASGQELAVLQVNSRAVLDEEGYERLRQLVANPPLPLAVWVGPSPALAYGGLAVLVNEAEVAAIAPPGSEIGLSRPEVLGVDPEPAEPGEILTAEATSLDLQPSLRQYLQALDGRTFSTANGPVTVSTLQEFGDGVTLKEVTFRKPGLGTRFFRLAVNPEAAFLFLMVGLTILAFEFYALGPGVAAGVAAVSLLLGGWGALTLPVRGWALALALLGWVLLTAAHQKGGIFALSALGAVALQVAGTFYIDGAAQLDPRWWLVLPTVLAVLLFYLIAMPVVQRSRLSTHSIGRDHLIGQKGVALVDFDPDGAVEVSGARWRATAHREAGIRSGDPVVVTGVDGLYLEVEPAVREN
ncbi:MAG: NfeD family protein [Acidimicrobiia bacterium]